VELPLRKLLAVGPYDNRALLPSALVFIRVRYLQGKLPFSLCYEIKKTKNNNVIVA